MNDQDKKSSKKELSLHPDTLMDIIAVTKRIEQLLDEKNHPIVVALDGRSGTGKSTLAEIIAEKVEGIYVHTDDFWSGGENTTWDARSSEEKVALAIDWRRMQKEVIQPLREGKQASWHPFDFTTGSSLSEKVITKGPNRVIILDGAYSARPELEDVIELKVLVEVPDDQNRRSRLIGREGDAYMTEWHKRWDPAEDYYFSIVRSRDTFDMFIVNH